MRLSLVVVFLIYLLNAIAPAHLLAARPARTEDIVKINVFEYSPLQPQKTLTDFLKFVRKNSQGIDNLRAQYLVAELFIQQGNHKQASEILQGLAAVALNDEFFNISVLQKLADCYMHLGLFQQAAESYTNASQGNIKAIVPESVLGLAVTSLALGHREEAYLKFQELTAFYPAYKNQTRFMLPLGLIQWENSKYEDALAYFSKDGKNPASLYFAGLCQRSLKRPVDAMATFKKIVREHSNTVWADRAKFELGETFYQQKDFPLAYKSFSPIFEENPSDLWQILALYRLACSDLHVKRYRPAETKYWALRRQTKKHPLYPRVTYLLTESLAEQKKIMLRCKGLF
ncbi:MAG: tetratricopeptide repeat protein, partial [Elusimicrobia bacterium]|nr:tetratricopeptide repeat protein [Elusimicrobiota bacterium]